MSQILKNTIKINQPVVVVPADEYELLLKEAGYIDTPELEKEIYNARKRFAKNKVVKWDNLKSELKKL